MQSRDIAGSISHSPMELPSFPHPKISLAEATYLEERKKSVIQISGLWFSAETTSPLDGEDGRFLDRSWKTSLGNRRKFI